MATTTLSLVLALGLLAGTAPEPAAPPEPASPSQDPRDPPPGTPADRELWKAARDASNALVAEQHVAADLTHRAKGGGYLDRLADPARRGGLPADRAEALARRLEEKWMASVDLMQSQWPVSKTRGCQYELLNLGAVMYADPSPRRAAQLREVRGATEDCLARAEKVLAAARRSSEELRAALVETERALGPPATVPAPASARK